MKITQEDHSGCPRLRRQARHRGGDGRDLAGLREKAEEFRKGGGEIYRSA